MTRRVPAALRAGLLATLMAAAPLAGAAELACADGAPLASPLRLDYAVRATRAVLSLNGDGTFVYGRQGDRYTMESTLQAFGIFEAHQTSAGTVTRDGLVPRVYSQRNSRRAARSVSFDWDARRVTFGQTGESEPSRPQLQDRLSLMMQLAWRSRKEPRARVITVPVAGLSRVSDYVFSAQGAEPVDVPAGRFEALRFERHKEGGDDALEVWLAPSLCSLPVRMRFTDDKGLVIDQQLRAVLQP